MKQGWEIKKLGDVCVFKSGTTISTSLEREIGDVLYVKVGDMNLPENEIEINTSSRFVNSNEIKAIQIIPEGAVIFPKRGGAIATNKKRKVIRPTIVDLNTMAIIPANKLDNEYFYYWFQMIDLNDISNGTTIPQINNYSFDNVHIAYPNSLPEQQRIVAILDETFSAIDKAKANAEQNLKNAKELFESYLQGVFEKKGVGWDETHLSEVCDFENGDRGKNYPNKSHRVSSGIPFINAGHLNENRLDFSDMDYISEERFNMLGNGKIKPNDILFCLRGSLGKVANVGNLDKGAIASSLVILRVKNELDNDFLLYFLNSNLTKKQIVDFGNGAAQPNLSAASLKKFIIPFPKSKEEQQTIVRQLDALRAETQKLEAVYQKKIDDLEELKKSILQKAFAGELGNGEPSEPKTEKSRRDDKIIENKINHPRTNPEGVK